MMEGDTFEAIQKPINKIQTVIHDSFLSQFKYHFVLKRLPIFHLINDKFRWNDLLLNLYKGFNAHFMGHNSLHIIQLLNVFPEAGLGDLIVGFRRDQHALKFYREIHVFEYQGQQYEVQVAEGFKTYLDELNERYRQYTFAKHRQAAERQKIRAQENQYFLQHNSQAQQKPKNSPIFVRQTSNPISVYQSKSQKSIPDIHPEQGEIIDTPRKSSTRRRNSSEVSSSRSAQSRNLKQQKYKKSNSKQNSSYDSRSDRFNRNRNSNLSKNYRKENSSRESSSSRSSSRSDSSSRSSRNRSSYYRKNGRSQRSREKRSYRRDSSSQYSSDSSRHKNSGQKKRNYQNSRINDDRRRSREDKNDKYDTEKKYEENRRYEIYAPSSYNRVYTSNYGSDRYREPPSQLAKKYSYEAYNAYRTQPGRYEAQYYDYQKQNAHSSSSSTYNYYKNVPGYSFPKPTQFQKKESYNSNNANDPKSPNIQSQYRYGNNGGSKHYY